MRQLYIGRLLYSLKYFTGTIPAYVNLATNFNCFRSNSTYLETEPKPVAVVPRPNISMSSLGLNPTVRGKSQRPPGQNPMPLGQNQPSLGQQRTALGPKPLSNQAGVPRTAASVPAQGASDPALPVSNPLLQRLNPAALGLDPGTTPPGLDPRSAALSPSSKYETPTPPLKNNQFVRNSALNRPRRKFSIIRERYVA